MKDINSPRYIIFAGDQYYPLGGWDDLFGTAESLEEAKILYKKGFNTVGSLGLQERWAHIVDAETNKIILEGTSWPDIDVINEWKKNNE